MIFEDERGKNIFNFNETPFYICQSMTTLNNQNVLRGLHCSPYKKFIVCNKGHIFDVIVYPDGTYKNFNLKEGDSLLIPENCAHGYYCYEESILTYFLEEKYDPSREKNYHWSDPTLNIQWPCENPIVSKKDSENPLFREVEHVVLGSSGFIGGWIKKAFPGCITTHKRLHELEDFLKFIKPKYVISAAGISGKPTIQWCEENKYETLDVNVTCQLMLAKWCEDIGAHLTIVGSGSIYRNPGIYTEDDIPDYTDMFYCKTRILLEQMLDTDKVLYLRVMYPISNDGHSKCFLSKLKTRLTSIHNTKINFTYLPTMMVDVLPELVHKNVTGIFNFVNNETPFVSELIKQEHTVIDFDGSRPQGLLINTKLRNYKILTPVTFS